MTNLKMTIKPKPGYIGTKEIFESGILVGEFDFDRTKNERLSRINVKTSGEIRWLNGRVVDISNYAFYSDVCRHIRGGCLS